MKTLTLSILAALLIGPSLASARILETMEECEARYGKPIYVPKPNNRHIPNTKVIWYEKSELTIGCMFRDGVCMAIMYFAEVGDAGENRPLTDLEIQTLMEANAGAEWRKGVAKPAEDTREWFSGEGDKILMAVYEEKIRKLTICTGYLAVDVVRRHPNGTMLKGF